MGKPKKIDGSQVCEDAIIIMTSFYRHKHILYCLWCYQ